ncbi:Chromosome partition protein Smc [Austwickia sp. TVS 96-490-7B]|uniref:MMPL family transporter n=1 Tax=Austwickia sp. TVS 96-490-7B TaxID=2830843 RepID=UPI001C5779F9|nr:MMPL family transporter [Austwickia sp. TVS 96-490-7B]MBW3087066.1 Chromosome partition protein Smc [Austwickia sp. TVS 96-490-7B]
MATTLYQLGRIAAQRAWVVVLIWVLILTGTATAAVTFRGPFAAALTIPGTEFQNVLDDLHHSLPRAAVSIGTVIFSTRDGSPLTDNQRRAVADVIARWKKIDGIDDVIDPFATQRQLDDAATKVTDGRARIAAGRRKINDSERALDAAEKSIRQGQRTLDDTKKKLDDGRHQLDEGRRKYDAGRREYDANASKLTDGRRHYDEARATLEAGRREYDANASKLADGRRHYDEARAALDTRQRLVDSGQREVDQALSSAGLTRSTLPTTIEQLQTARATLRHDYDTARSEYGDDDPRTQKLLGELRAVESRLTPLEKLAATITTLTSGQTHIDSGRKHLDGTRARLESAAAALATAKTRLDTGSAQLHSAADHINTGQRRLDAATAQLNAATTEIITHQQRLDTGLTQWEDGRRKLDAARKKLAAGKATTAHATAALPASETQLTRGERRMALTHGMRAVTERGDVAAAQVLFTQRAESVPAATKKAIPAEATSLEAAAVEATYSREISQELSIIGPGEITGLAIAGIVLIVMLGSLLAAGLPLLTALIGVAVGILGAISLTARIDMADITPALALMLGLAVGIDYALFLVNRHREQLCQGVPLVESIARATGTAGSAVLFAGLTVVVALSALTLTGIPFLGVMGVVAAATVAVAVVVSITLTPALLSLLAGRVLSPRSRRTLAATLHDEQDDATSVLLTEGHGRGWGGLVTRHPWVTLIVATMALSVLAIPAGKLALGLPDASYEPQDTTAYRTYQSIADHFGAGRNGPIIAVATVEPSRATRPDDPDGVTDLQLDVGEKLRAITGVSYVVPFGASDDRRTLAFQVVPTTGPSDEATTTLVHQLRRSAPEIVTDAHLTSLGYAGQTVANIDISAALAAALPTYLLVVVGISLVLLLLVFRSVVVPLLATGGFLLSVAAAFGAVVLVYQWGWLGSLLGVSHPGRVLSFLPTLVIGILFGLALDYQMFLVSGMREAWAHGHPARAAVRSGYRHGARVVTAAALIMTAVFGSFVHAELTMIRPIGFALAIGVLIDAFIVRMTAMPAVMHLVGERAWYLPQWLDRVLPDLDVEGTRMLAARTSENPATSLDDPHRG